MEPLEAQVLELDWDKLYKQDLLLYLVFMVQLHYNEHANNPGIYVIFNSHTWRIYVGQAQSFKKRWYDHQKGLRSGNHQNKFLLNDFNKCREELGHDNFLEFHVLEVMPESTKEQRNLREEHWIGVHWDKQEQCYNFRRENESKPRSCYSRTPEETSREISSNMKRVWSDPVMRAKRLQIHQSEEFREKQRNKRLEIASNKEADPSRLGSIAAWQDPIKRAEHIEKIKAAPKRVYTEELRQKQSLTCKSKGIKPPPPIKKPVVGTNLLTGEILVFESIKRAQETLGISGIWRNIAGKRKSAGGFSWRYAD